MSVMSDAERIVGDLFARYLAEPAAMAPRPGTPPRTASMSAAALGSSPISSPA